MKLYMINKVELLLQILKEVKVSELQEVGRRLNKADLVKVIYGLTGNQSSINDFDDDQFQKRMYYEMVAEDIVD